MKLQNIIKSILLSISVVFLVACSPFYDELIRQWGFTPPHELTDTVIGHRDFTVIDTQRDNRSLPIHVWYPADPESASQASRYLYPLNPFANLGAKNAYVDPAVIADKRLPLIIFSHGFESGPLQSPALMEALASHGFIVVSIEHIGNSTSMPGDAFPATKRVPDVSFVIDQMMAKNNDPDDAFYQRIASNKIGVIGHSYGGATAIGMAAGWAGGKPDPRVKAVAALTGPFVEVNNILGFQTEETTFSPFTKEQFQSINIPVLLIGGTSDKITPIANHEFAFEHIPQHVYRADFLKAAHSSFSNVCEIGDFLIDGGFPKTVWPSIGAQRLLDVHNLTCSPQVMDSETAHRLLNNYAVAFFKVFLQKEFTYLNYMAEYNDFSGEQKVEFYAK